MTWTERWQWIQAKKYRIEQGVWRTKNKLVVRYGRKIPVEGTMGTLEKIIKDRVSVCRFGDGELMWIIGAPQKSFQKDDPHMRARLQEVLSSHRVDCIVCIPDAFGDLSEYIVRSRAFWNEHMGRYRSKWLRYIDRKEKYYNSLCTRFYIIYQDKSRSGEIVELWKQVWHERDVCIVEGALTRLGIGNDLLDNAKSVKRILAPAMNAFSCYDKLLATVKSNVPKETLVLLALGPTATVMAYDLACEGYQAIDIGHIDVEYEWWRMGVTEKVPIPYKYVNEAGGKSNIELTDEDNMVYQESIITMCK